MVFHLSLVTFTKFSFNSYSLIFFKICFYSFESRTSLVRILIEVITWPRNRTYYSQTSWYVFLFCWKLRKLETFYLQIWRSKTTDSPQFTCWLTNFYRIHLILMTTNDFSNYSAGRVRYSQMKEAQVDYFSFSW